MLPPIAAAQDPEPRPLLSAQTQRRLDEEAKRIRALTIVGEEDEEEEEEGDEPKPAVGSTAAARVRAKLAAMQQEKSLEGPVRKQHLYETVNHPSNHGKNPPRSLNSSNSANQPSLGAATDPE